MTAPQLFSACLGSVLCLGSLAAFLRYRTRRFKALFWLAIGSAMVYAAFRPQFIEAFGADSSELRLRLVVGLLSFLVLTLTLESIRVARMQERYAFLWLASGLALLLGSLLGDLTLLITRLTGMSYADTVLVMLFAILLLMVFSLSIALSRLQRSLAQTAIAVAGLEARLRRIEAASHSGATRPAPDHRSRDDGTPPDQPRKPPCAG